jgi:ppGpp synthetase/RelA/SpoT-type nucleotidyltranferase
VRTDEKLVEIQVRTALQHRWAEVSEKLADSHGIEVKYGGGPEGIRDWLSKIAALIARIELQRRSPDYEDLHRDIERLLQDMISIWG